MVTLENDFERVALGGLLHDIGKLFNRSDLYRKKGLGGEHPFLSAWFVDYLTENRVIEEDKVLKELVQKHHESRFYPKELNVSDVVGEAKKLALIVAKADNYSSMERDGDEKKRSYRSVPLDSIFSRIDIGKGGAPTTRYYLREWKNEELFSKNHEENSQEEINKIIEKFLGEIKNIGCVEFRTLYLRILELIKKYTWALPSDTQKEICDLSLYDHLKTTSAIAVASYNYCHVTQSSINNGKKEEQFLLIGGDVSGIQKYIYSLVNSKNIAKRLRARSFFIKILTEIASIKIVKELNLVKSNIVISNGGKFYIIAQNNEAARKKLKEIRKQINEELYNEYEGEIFLNLKWIGITGEELGIKFSEKFDKINDLLEQGKNKKFHDEILEMTHSIEMEKKLTYVQSVENI